MRVPPRLNLVVIRSLVPDQTVEFYERIGIAFKKEQHSSGPIHWSTEVGAVVLEVYPAKATADVDSTTRLGFDVPDLDAVITSFPADVIVQPLKIGEWGTRAIVQDPDGRRVELIERES